MSASPIRDELEGLRRAQARDRHLPVGARLRQGNYNDALMQALAQNGNGIAAYIDTLNEARKVLVEEAASTLFPIAKDVKIQVEFNPGARLRVPADRLRDAACCNREDFNNDKVDAGEIGAGHTVTAIYEITPAGRARSWSTTCATAAGGRSRRAARPGRRDRLPEAPLQAAEGGREPADRRADRRPAMEKRSVDEVAGRGALRDGGGGLRPAPARRPHYNGLTATTT